MSCRRRPARPGGGDKPYWKILIALCSVCQTPQAIGSPTQSQPTIVPTPSEPVTPMPEDVTLSARAVDASPA